MINQAVIFCGGMGSRLKNITKNIPKPMVLVAGKPFLEHLIVQLKKNGFKKVILLTGYKSEKIKKYFSNGNKFNIKIEYSFLPPNFETGSRLFKIKKKLNKKFLLMYCDNYSSINIHKINNELEKSKKKMILSISRKKNGNCKLNKDNSITYTPKRSNKNKFVEIGYMVIKRDLLKYLSKNDKDFSNFISRLSRKKMIAAHIQENGYLSISDPNRLNLTRRLFANNDYILTDRDGVLNHKSKKSRYITNLKDLKINESLCKKIPKNIKLICISNQAGIATKDIKSENLKLINKKLCKYLNYYKLKIEKFYISKHHFKSKSYFRKPNPGYFFKASQDYNFILDKTFYIGDDKRDIEAAYNANTFIIYVGKEKLSLNEKKKYNFVILNKSIKSVYNEKKKYRF